MATSQLDLDRGGTYRQFVRRWLGPSVGWVWVPEDNVLTVTTASGTALVGTRLITVNFNGAVTIQLPSSKASSTATQGALPGPALALPITVVDIGGFATTGNITILPFGSETIDSLASWVLANAYASVTLTPPNLTSGGWSA